MEHRRLSLPDSLLARLGSPDGSQPGTLALPSNDWWTYALVNDWTGKIWMYPGWVEATQDGIDIGYPDHWEETGNEVKWGTPLHISLKAVHSTKAAPKMQCVVDRWSDFSMSFLVRTNEDWVRVTCVHGSPLVWLESKGMTMTVTNPDASKYWVKQTDANSKAWTIIGLRTDGLTDERFEQYAGRVPRKTRMRYAYNAAQSTLTTTFSVTTQSIDTGGLAAKTSCLLAFLPHHYYSAENTAISNQQSAIYNIQYLSPRGQMRVAEGNDFTFVYPVHSMLPFFPAPMAWKEDFSKTRMAELNADYAKKGSFGGDTYWGGKGLTQMAHYMTFALQMGDTATFRLAKQRLKQTLIDWYTYTPGEEMFYFARYPRWGALVGFDTSYDSDTFNDHHFHYGYFVYASAILCMLDDDFRAQYGAMAREVARDYANWQRPTTNDQRLTANDQPWFRTLDPYCGHSFAGGMGNGGNGNGQESTSEAIQGWGGVWMLGAALQDKEMLEAGIMGYTLETRATAEYWFDRKRRNIDYTKYKHPYCCNLTMQGVGWWTWFSGDPVWMHSIQWLPISPVLTNHFCQDLAFTRWDYTQMYAGKEVKNYEAESGGLGDESGLGNVCLSYLSLFDADSAARVWNRMDKTGKALAKNPDTGGITYWLIHSHKALGEKRIDIFADHPLACAYTDTVSGRTVFAVYNVAAEPLTVRFFGALETTLSAPHGLTLFDGEKTRTVTTIADEPVQADRDPLAWDLPYPNLALHKPVTASSVENAGCLASFLTDGNLTTRWGSNHHDNEYVIVDLGQTCYIDRLILRWEASYAPTYELGFSYDAATWRTAELSSAGGVETVDHATFNAQLSSSRTRYIRVKGLTRASAYGISLYELEAYGRPFSGDLSKVFAIELKASDTVLCQGQSATLSATAYNINGQVLSAAPQYTVVSGNASLNGNRLTCPDYGFVTVQAAIDDCTASLTLCVLETERTDSIAVSPAEVSVPIGDRQTFTVSTLNQFGDIVETCRLLVSADRLGDSVVTCSCGGQSVKALMHVLPYNQVNLALGKPATVSGYENAGTQPQNAVDGDFTTRWGSRFMDDEWLEVDLRHCYSLDSVRLFWETAYATAYEILLSQDAVHYSSVFATATGKGGTERITLSSSARYLRLVCHKRNTQYGASLFEIQVFGSTRCDSGEQEQEQDETIHDSPYADDTGDCEDEEDEQPDQALTEVTADRQTCTKLLIDGQLYLIHKGRMYNVQGQPVK
jgi:endoglucanase Acf2